MAHDVPVVARAAASPETLGGGAVLVDTDDAAAIAAVVATVVEDGALRGRLVDAGRRHPARYAPDAVRGRWEAARAALDTRLELPRRRA